MKQLFLQLFIIMVLFFFMSFSGYCSETTEFTHIDYTAKIADYIKDKWLDGISIDRDIITKDVYRQGNVILKEMGFGKLPPDERNKQMPEIKRMTGEAIDIVIDMNIEAQQRNSQEYLRIPKDRYAILDQVPEKVQENIQKIRANIAEEYRGMPVNVIEHKQDEAESVVHIRVIEAAAVDSPERALIYLNIPRVREVILPKEWGRLRDNLKRKINYASEREQRISAFQSGEDNLIQQLIQDNQSMRDDIEFLRSEVDSLRDQLGRKPNIVNDSYSSLDDSTEARLYRQSEKLNEFIRQLEIDRMFSR
jgi:hypothetical protein